MKKLHRAFFIIRVYRNEYAFTEREINLSCKVNNNLDMVNIVLDHWETASESTLHFEKEEYHKIELVKIRKVEVVKEYRGVNY